jgi:hypothetical protein
MLASMTVKGGVVARYYFDIRDGTGLYPDEEGVELPDQRAAEIEAARTLGGLARDLAVLEDPPDIAVEVRTESGPIFQAAFIFETNRAKQ